MSTGDSSFLAETRILFSLHESARGPLRGIELQVANEVLNVLDILLLGQKATRLEITNGFHLGQRAIGCVSVSHYLRLVYTNRVSL